MKGKMSKPVKLMVAFLLSIVLAVLVIASAICAIIVGVYVGAKSLNMEPSAISNLGFELGVAMAVFVAYLVLIPAMNEEEAKVDLSGSPWPFLKSILALVMTGAAIPHLMVFFSIGGRYFPVSAGAFAPFMGWIVASSIETVINAGRKIYNKRFAPVQGS